MNDILTPEERAAAKARCEAATPGPWEMRGPNDADQWTLHSAGVMFAAGCRMPCNAEFIAHTRTDLPLALATIEAFDNALLAIARFHEGETVPCESCNCGGECELLNNMQTACAVVGWKVDNCGYIYGRVVKS